MSIKNQSRLPIFASLIIGVTIACLFGLNLIVDKISKIQPPSVARQDQPPPGLKPPVGGNQRGQDQPDDEYKDPNGGPLQAPNGQAPKPGQRMDRPGPAMPTPGSEGVMRRVQNGKNNPELQPKGPPSGPPPQQNGPAPGKAPTMPQPPGPGGGGPPYPPGGMNLSPEERDAMERELERRRQMMQDGRGPDPTYYPPPPDFYPSPYDGQYYDDYEDYDYYPGYQGKLDNDKSSVVKLSDQDQEDDDLDPDDYLVDDYLRDDEED